MAQQDRYLRVRETTERLAGLFEIEDLIAQAAPEASPVKWHLAHTTWFFETFLLARRPAHRPFEDRWGALFNSYYLRLGPEGPFPRPLRGTLSRPTMREVFAYRRAIDRQLLAMKLDRDEEAILALGIAHEEQHQELILTDTKLLLGSQPLRPAIERAPLAHAAAAPRPLSFVEIDAGPQAIGALEGGFSFDNERPRHQVWLTPFRLASRPVNAGEYAEFIEDGGYRRPELWLSDGWTIVIERGLTAPLYWQRAGRGWTTYGFGGQALIDAAAPVCHLSYFEADAYARWANKRLPTEAEWERAASSAPIAGNFLESDRLAPAERAPGGPLAQLFGDVWEWTQSPYVAYPGYRAPEGVLGEYNGKFMCNQLVLRGGSCFTPRDHVRASYRNFFPPDARWQMSGIRLAEDA